MGISYSSLFFLSIFPSVLGVYELVAAVDGHDGGEGGGARCDCGGLAESGAVVAIAAGVEGRKLWRRRADVSGGVQPGGLRLRYQVVISAPPSRLRLLLGTRDCLPHPDAYLLIGSGCGSDGIIVCLGNSVFLLICLAR